jgi:hypothetical protein
MIGREFKDSGLGSEEDFSGCPKTSAFDGQVENLELIEIHEIT